MSETGVLPNMKNVRFIPFSAERSEIFVCVIPRLVKGIP